MQPANCLIRYKFQQRSAFRPAKSLGAIRAAARRPIGRSIQTQLPLQISPFFNLPEFDLWLARQFLLIAFDSQSQPHHGAIEFRSGHA